MSKSSAPQPYSPADDLIEDRAIEDSKADSFGHDDFALQTAETVQVIRTPANIAIYAPWGSGKSSLANLIQKALAKTNVKFVRFDAFKYAEAPLRREFIRSVAKELDIKDKKHDKYDKGLYEESQESDVNLDPASARSLVRLVCILVGAGLFLTAVIAWILAEISGKGIGSQWVREMERLLPAVFAPTVVVGAIVTLVAQKFSITRTRFAPQSDEQFERLFRDLISEAKGKFKDCDRFVIFIDELDRCGAEEVASTLETLRTFLEVEDCVFIVAADRSVLETAVAKRSRQETPLNTKNPYYSAGSSYLDKIFQYQWQLPPMKASSLTKFAQDLVKDRKVGLWSEVNTGEVVSVLVPLHVQSPRRVKELLNAYAMAYRIAERRIADHHLDGDLRGRSAELAKLVCLQMEFPSFANDLPNEPRLPQFVLSLLTNPDVVPPSDVTDEVWERAQSYALGTEQLDVVIATSEGEEGADDQEDLTRQIIAAQGPLLVRYLQKTRRVPGPQEDLVFMEGPGFAFGLPTALASRLKLAATEGRVTDIVAALQPLDIEQQLAGLRLLAMHVQEALPGVEGENSLSSLLGAVGALPDLDISGIVDDLADAVNSALEEDKLPADDIVGAMCLGLATVRPVGHELVGRALLDTSVVTNEATAGFIARRASEFGTDHTERLGNVVASLLADLEWPDATNTVLSWTDDDADKILGAAGTHLLRIIKQNDADRKAREEAAAAAATPTPGVLEQSSEPVSPMQGAEEEISASDHARDYLGTLVEAAHEHGRTSLVESLVLLILSIDEQPSRDLVEEMLPSLGKATTVDLSEQLLISSRVRALNRKHIWLEAIDGNVLKQSPRAIDLVDEAVLKAWNSNDADLPQTQSFASSASPIVKSFDWSGPKTLKVVRESGSITSLDSAGVSAWELTIGRAETFEESGLIPDDWRHEFFETAVVLASSSPPDDVSLQSFASCLLDVVPSLTNGEPKDQYDRLLEALTTSASLRPAQRCLARVKVLAHQKLSDPEIVFSSLPSEIVAVQALDSSEESTLGEDRNLLYEAIEVWLSNLRPSISEIWEVIGAYANFELPEPILRGLRKRADELTATERSDLAALSLNGFPESVPSDNFLDAARFHEADLAQEVQLLVNLYDKATNDDSRRALLRLCASLRLTNHQLTSRVLDGIMIPMIRANKSGRDVALQNLHLVNNLSKRDKSRLSKAAEEAADENEWDSISYKLVQGGFMEETGPFFNRRRKHFEG